MIWLWRYFVGYLKISINGENGEQVINRAAANGIGIWSLSYKNGCIYGNISVKDFCRLKNVKRGVRCKIKIIKRRGAYFKLKNYKNRVGFIFGFIIFSVILFVLSNFVWVINVEGNNNIPTEQILASCRQIGIYEGVLKSKINNKYDAQRLQLLEKDIAWCGLNVEGSVLTVNLSEAAISDKEQRQSPSNLKAAAAGKIKRVDVTMGNTVVKVGDTVSKGDLLVSGVIENMSSTLFVHSDGVVIAETKRVFSAEGKFDQLVEQETGETIVRYTIQFFNIKIPLYLGNVKKTHIYSEDINYLTLFSKRVPIKIAREQYNLTQKTSVNYDKTTLEEMLYNDIKKQVDSFSFISATECGREIVSTKHGILMKITYVCEENIAVQDEILLSKEN